MQVGAALAQEGEPLRELRLTMGLDAQCDIFPKQPTDAGSLRFGQQLRSPRSGMNGVCFLNHEVAPSFMTTHRHGKGETKQQSQQSQHRGGHAAAILRFFRFSPAACQAYAPSKLRKS